MKARRIFAVLLGLWLALLTTSVAWARSELKLEAERDVVGVGQAFDVTLQFVSDDGTRADKADLGPTPGFKVLGQTKAPIHSRFNFNGQVSVRTGLLVTWTLRPEKVGRFTLGPATITIGATKTKSAPVQVEVRKDAPEPADPFSSILRGFGQPEARRAPDPADPKLALDAPRDEAIFLHATADRREAVMGEQITWTLDLYREEDMGEPDFLEVKEAACDDCLKQPLLPSDRLGATVGIAEIQGKRYEVKRERKLALFPMRTGTVRMTPMSLVLATRGRPRRESEAFDLVIKEPPAEGRPPGYTLGDTGQFELRCEVSPREVPVSGSVYVTVTLTGRGNFPSKLKAPVARAFAFASGDVKDAFDVDESGRLGGSRAFSYVVRMEEPGDTDLGPMRFPYYEPSGRAYHTATCDLGHVTVTGVKAPETERTPLLPPLPPVRDHFEGPARRGHLADSRYFLGSSLALPLGAVLLLGAGWARRRVRAQKEAQGPSLAEPRRALRAFDEGKGTRDAALRAACDLLDATARARFGVGLRAFAKEDAEQALEEAGASREEAQRFATVYETASQLRFGEATDDDVRSLVRDVESLL